MQNRRNEKVRVQLDLPAREADALDAMRDRYALGSRADVVRTALAVMEWIHAETEDGRRIYAVGSDYVTSLALPGIIPVSSTKPPEVGDQ